MHLIVKGDVGDNFHELLLSLDTRQEDYLEVLVEWIRLVQTSEVSELHSAHDSSPFIELEEFLSREAFVLALTPVDVLGV